MNHKQYKIFIINANDWFNKGDLLNRIGAISALKRQMGKSVRIAVESATYEHDREYFVKYDVDIVKSIYSYKPGDRMYKMIPRFVFSSIILIYYALIFTILKGKPNDKSNESTYLRSILNSDLILSSPGGFIHDELPLTVFFPSLFQIGISLFLKKHVIIFAQSIGPLTHRFSRIITKIILSRRRVSFIILRENVSLSLLRKMGITENKMIVTADASFSIPHEIILRANEHARLTKKQISPVLVGITVLNQYWKSKPLRERYVRTIAMLVDWLVEKFGAYVLFIPWRLSFADAQITKDIHTIIKHKNSVELSFHDYTPEDLLGVVGSLDILVGTRLHSCIAAALMNVPFLCISYQPKSKGIAQMLGMDEYIFQISSLNLKELESAIDKLWNERQRIQKFLQIQMRKMRERSEKSARVVKSLVDTLKTC